MPEIDIDLELERRREGIDLVRSVPVRMADGREWLLPKPWVEIHPVFADGRPVDHWLVLTYGPELDGLIKAISEAEDDTLAIVATLGLGAFLLRRNYDLSDEDLAEILVYRSGEPESQAMGKAIINVAMGRTGPKAWRGGGA